MSKIGTSDDLRYVLRGGEYEQENICTAYTASWIQPATSIPHQRRLHSFRILQLGRGQRTGGVARWLGGYTPAEKWEMCQM